MPLGLDIVRRDWCGLAKEMGEAKIENLQHDLACVCVVKSWVGAWMYRLTA